MSKPRLLDLYCGAGGATRGYQEAGFYVIGVDLDPQPDYLGDRFIQADAIEFLERMVAGGTWEWVGPGIITAVHASPPCQAYSSMTAITGRAAQHPELIGPTRELLRALGRPYVIENVPRAPLLDPIVLCGSHFGLAVAEGELRRHRLFECSFPIDPLPKCRHPRGGRTLGVYGGGTRQGERSNPGGGNTPKANKAQAQALMGIDWMTRDQMCQAVPPVYTEYVGRQLMRELGR